MKKNILLIEDNAEICSLLEFHLKNIGIQLDIARDGAEGLELALNNEYSLVMLDSTLPGTDGFEVCRSLREKKKRLPVLMLTSKNEEFDKVLCLESGADDYISKPFSILELLAKIKSILRRVKAFEQESEDKSSEGVLHFGELRVNVEKHRVTVENNLVRLTPKEFDLLKLFISNPGKVFTREILLNVVWGHQFSGYEHTVDSHINRLRAKIERDPPNPNYIRTIWGVGYKFADQEDLTP
ncbi:MAG: response regulator transcription factor [Calditrichaeota bacterium]|nr:response regulator transcription factor [Calditrichota bacterium]